MRIKLPDEIFGKKVDEAIERVLAEEQENQKQPPKLEIPAGVNVQGNKDFWRVPNVEYRGRIEVVDLSKSLLDNGAEKSQDEWVKYRLIAEPKGEFYTGDMPLHHALFKALYHQRNTPESEEARAFIQKQMRARWLTTLTRIAYTPNGLDKLIHNHGISDRYFIAEDIIGPDRTIEADDKNTLKALLGTDNISEISAVYNWINNTPAYIFRLNSKPKQVDERVAGFVAGSGRADLCCCGGPGIADASFGLRVVREKI